MDRSRLDELAYKAQLGQTVALDNFEAIELIKDAAKVPALQGKLGDYFSGIKDSAGEIETASDGIRRLVASAFEQIEENKADFPECFLLQFKDILERIKLQCVDIDGALDDVNEGADDGEDFIYTEVF